MNVIKYYKITEETINNISFLLENIEIAKGTQNALRLAQLGQLLQQAQPIEEDEKTVKKEEKKKE